MVIDKAALSLSVACCDNNPSGQAKTRDRLSRQLFQASQLFQAVRAQIYMCNLDLLDTNPLDVETPKFTTNVARLFLCETFHR